MTKETPEQKSWERARFLFPIGKENIDSIVDVLKSFISGAGAGVISKTAVAPMERTKILAQTEAIRNSKRDISRIIIEYVGQ